MEQVNHDVKSWSMFFRDIITGKRTSDIRLNDRRYQVGDMLTLNEFDPVAQKFTGRIATADITYIQTNKSNPCAISHLALADEYVVLSIALDEVHGAAEGYVHFQTDFYDVAKDSFPSIAPAATSLAITVASDEHLLKLFQKGEAKTTKTDQQAFLTHLDACVDVWAATGVSRAIAIKRTAREMIGIFTDLQKAQEEDDGPTVFETLTKHYDNEAKVKVVVQHDGEVSWIGASLDQSIRDTRT